MNPGCENTVVRIELCKTIKALCSPGSCLSHQPVYLLKITIH